MWSFNGGAVAIQGLPNGAFQGTVVSPTKFASGEHPAGQVMWTEMRPQPDGSYWGVKRVEKKGVTLRKLPTGTYKTSVVATTVLNQHLSGSKTYKSCTKGSGKLKLKPIKKHHHH